MEGERIYNSPILKFARTRTKMLSRSQRFKDGASGIETSKGDVVTAPVELDVLLLEGQKDNQSTNSDGAGEG